MSIKVSRRNTGVNFLLDGKAEIILWAPLAEKAEWMKVTDTHANVFTEDGQVFGPGDTVKLQSRSIVLLKQPRLKKAHEHGS
jgi:hypothetical protein